MATTLEVYPSDALLWLEFGGQYIGSDGKVRIDNLASRGDAPATVLCGDGSTANTIPAQATKRGVVFTGTQYVDTGIVDPFERTDKFSLFVVHAITNSTAIIASSDANQVDKGVLIIINSSTNTACSLISSTSPSSWLKLDSTAGASPVRTIKSTCFTYDGSSAAAGGRYYTNAISSYTVGVDTLSGTIKNGKPFLLGARHNGASKTNVSTGTIYFAAIFPRELTATQVASLHKRVMRRLALP